jgi:hypothetical protein
MIRDPSGAHWGGAPLTIEWIDTSSSAVSTFGD